MCDQDIDARNGLEYAKSVETRSIQGRRGDYQAAFILRAAPIEQVRAVAETGETMPPKSTYFYPKLLSGMAFNPVGEG